MTNNKPSNIWFLWDIDTAEDLKTIAADLAVKECLQNLSADQVQKILERSAWETPWVSFSRPAKLDS
jgi:hypothetical protein